VKAKKDEHVASLDTIDGINKFEIATTKSNKILIQVMNASFSIQLRNDVTWKDKWGALVGDFKKIYDYKTGAGNNQNYWSLNLNEKLA
jgi:hypothetical protein